MKDILNLFRSPIILGCVVAIFACSIRIYALAYYSKNKKIKIVSRVCGFIAAFGLLKCFV